jgi:hypothetical protein
MHLAVIQRSYCRILSTKKPARVVIERLVGPLLRIYLTVCTTFSTYLRGYIYTIVLAQHRLPPGLAGEDVIFLWIGMLEYIPCYSAPAVHWVSLPASRLASRKILIEQNITRQTGPTLYVFSLLDTYHKILCPPVKRYGVHWKWKVYIFLNVCTGQSGQAKNISKSYCIMINNMSSFYSKSLNEL